MNDIASRPLSRNRATTRAAPPRAAARLLVFIPPRRLWSGGSRGTLSSASALAYLALDADGAATPGEAPLAALPKARALELVLDALDVYSDTIEAPALSEARLRQALPNMLEERLLADPAECHFAAAPPAAAAAGGTLALPVAAIERATLARVLEACAQAQLTPRAAYSALYTVPAPQEGVYCLRTLGNRGLLRIGRDQGCQIDLDEGGAAALALAVRQQHIARLRVYGPPSEAIAALVQAAGVEAAYAADALDTPSLDGAVNLLQGVYAPDSGFGSSGRLLARLARNGAWRAPALWLGVCAVLAVAGLNAYWWQLEARFADLRATMHQTFRDGFPGESDTYLLEQARRSVAALRARSGRPSGDDFSVLNAQALQLLAAAPPGIVTGIDYADTVYRLHFRGGSADDAALRNALQARAIAQGLALRFDADGSARLGPREGDAWTR